MTIINKMKSLTARVIMDEHDVRALLEKDHDEAKKIAQQMIEATQPSRRMALLYRLKPALTAHSRAEESAVYDALLAARNTESHDIANEGYVEHGLVDQLLTDLADTNPRDDRWKAQAKVLKELLEHHIDEEQSDTFAELGERFDGDQLAAMGVKFLNEKAKVIDGRAVRTRAKTASSEAIAKSAKKSVRAMPGNPRAKRPAVQRRASAAASQRQR